MLIRKKDDEGYTRKTFVNLRPMKEKKRPLILVTNDDGYTAKGILNLAQIASKFGDVLIVAPYKAQSGMGHAITIHDPLKIQEIELEKGLKGYSCSGTPVDCVKSALHGLSDRRPDLLVSGINHGANFSINVIYSGTMSAAVEGALENIPSIGFSLLDYHKDADFSESRWVVERVIEKALSEKFPEHTCLNVNIPKTNGEKLKGIKVCRQGVGIWQDELVKREDPMGNPYYWLAGEFKEMDKGQDTDIYALKNRYVSVVPTQFDMTAHQHIPTISNWEL